jgi:Xaa-Pro aminopeptidase
MLNHEGCRKRQQRLMGEMQDSRWDLFVTADYRTAYYFTSVLSSPEAPTLFLLWSDGSSALISSAKAEGVCDEMIYLETYSIQRPISLASHDANTLFVELLRKRQSSTVKRCALERASVNGLFESSLRNCYPRLRLLDASVALLSLRKKKEADEIDSIRESLRYCEVAYRAAKEAISPGLTELDVYNAMYTAVVKAAGTTIAFAGDFACGERGISDGGPPSQREILPGDLYILDIFPAVRLYYADTCRTFAVTEPTDRQQRAWEAVMQAVQMAEQMIKPGVRARDVYKTVKEFLDSQEVTQKSFWHHAGHGLGYRGHEAPRIIPGSEDVFEEGDVFTLEPGVYTKELQGGIRLEDNYVVRAHRVEDLFSFPWELWTA